MKPMKILLAGYNLDTEVIPNRADATPETLSASYARISRDPRPIDELRKVARGEVEKSRRSNQSIIFKMGHHSVAEHAVFNFDLIGVSRLALEEIEKFRLCSYTEKSQRYQKLEDNYLVPDEVKAAGQEKGFIKTVTEQNSTYQQLVNEGIEPEDARYVTSLATLGQVGMTLNARNLEFLFRRFASHPLAEVREIGEKMFGLVESIAPSIILFAKADDFDQKTYPELKKAIKGSGRPMKRLRAEVELKAYDKEGDDRLIAALIHTSTNLDYDSCLKQAKGLSKAKKLGLIEKTFKYAEFYDRPLREFEFPDLTYEIVLSAACFGQLKRHRMATLTTQPYDPSLGVMIPPAIVKAGLAGVFKKAVIVTEQFYRRLSTPYALTNAHRRRVLFKCNARELYHISRLREDPHAQWDIMNISRQMTALAKKVMPLTMTFAGGKDAYPAIYEKHFGVKPKVLPQY